MPTGFYFRFAAFVFTATLCGAIVYAWQADRRDRAQLAAELASTKQLLGADARQHDRDAQLAQTLAALAKERDDAVRIAKGGSALRRITRAAKWFLLGAAAGAVVARAH